MWLPNQLSFTKESSIKILIKYYILFRNVKFYINWTIWLQESNTFNFEFTRQGSNMKLLLVAVAVVIAFLCATVSLFNFFCGKNDSKKLYFQRMFMEHHQSQKVQQSCPNKPNVLSMLLVMCQRAVVWKSSGHWVNRNCKFTLTIGKNVEILKTLLVSLSEYSQWIFHVFLIL